MPLPTPRFFFVYILLCEDPPRIESHVVCGDDFDTLIRTKAFVTSGITVKNLLYISNVKEGTHAERLARGEVPPQTKSPYRVIDPRYGSNPDYIPITPAPCEDAFQGGRPGFDVDDDPDGSEGDSPGTSHDITDFLTDEERRLRDSC